jgi:hypothetical protein
VNAWRPKAERSCRTGRRQGAGPAHCCQPAGRERGGGASTARQHQDRRREASDPAGRAASPGRRPAAAPPAAGAAAHTAAAPPPPRPPPALRQAGSRGLELAGWLTHWLVPTARHASAHAPRLQPPPHARLRCLRNPHPPLSPPNACVHTRARTPLQPPPAPPPRTCQQRDFRPHRVHRGPRALQHGGHIHQHLELAAVHHSQHLGHLRVCWGGGGGRGGASGGRGVAGRLRATRRQGSSGDCQQAEQCGAPRWAAAQAAPKRAAPPAGPAPRRGQLPRSWSRG